MNKLSPALRSFEQLLRREMWSQAHRQYPRRKWRYPGPVWWMILHLLPLMLHVRLYDPAGESFLRTLTATSVLLAILYCSRSTLYCAVSMAFESSQNCFAVLRTTPLFSWRVPAAKLLACLLPMWIEIAAGTLAQLLIFSAYGGVNWLTVVAVNAFLWACSLVFGCLGLWIGVLLNDTERAAASARTVSAVILFGTYLAEGLPQESTAVWPWLLIGAVLWTLIHLRSQQTVPVVIGFLVLFLGVHLSVKDLPYQFRLTAYHPLSAVASVSAREPDDHLLRPEYETMLSASKQSLRDQVSVEETRRRARRHLLPTAGIYLLLSLGLYGWTFTRVKTAT